VCVCVCVCVYVCMCVCEREREREDKKAYGVLGGRPKGKRPLGTLGVSGRTLKLVLKK